MLAREGMQEPPLARALTGRAWSLTVVSAASLGTTATFAVLVDAGWSLAQGFLGAIIVGALLALGALVARHQADTRQGEP